LVCVLAGNVKEYRPDGAVAHISVVGISLEVGLPPFQFTPSERIEVTAEAAPAGIDRR